MKNLDTLTTKDLKALARDAGVKGWWDMKKAELIEAIEKAEVNVIVSGKEEVKPDVNTLGETENASEDESEAQDNESKKKNQKRLIEHNGKTQTLNAWAKELGIRHQTLYNRIVMKGWEIDRAFEKPAKKEVTANAESTETE